MAIVHEGRIIDANERFARLTGWKVSELAGREPAGGFRLRSREGLQSHHRGDGPGEIDLINVAGQSVPVEFMCRTVEYRGPRMRGDLRARPQRAQGSRAHYRASGPPRCADRSSQSWFLRPAPEPRSWRPAAAKNEQLAILCLDLDRFKAVNDIFGHGEGDRILMKVADILRKAVGEGDTVARLGGDEFAILQVGWRTARRGASTCRTAS